MRRQTSRARAKSPEQFIHDYLVRLQKADKVRLRFWEDYYLALARERDKRLDEITDALWAAKLDSFSENFSRIVEAKFATHPLCSIGSIRRPPGGRFNYDGISSIYSDFQCLYVTNNHSTAFAVPSSHLYVRVKASLENVIDIRNLKSLEKFCSVIASIQAPTSLRKRARRLGMKRLKTISNTKELKRSPLEPNFSQWATWISQPSNSQWFGYYAYKAGIQGIIYPSIRFESGYNVAIYPENFVDTEACLELIDEVPSIPNTLRRMDKNNFQFFMVELSKKNFEE